MSAVQKIEQNNLAELDAAQQERDLIRKTYGRELSDPEFALLVRAAEHEGLDVITGDMSAIRFDGAPVNFKRVQGHRKLADRSGLLVDTDGPYFCGTDGQWVELWLDDKKPPMAAKFMVWRSDRARPITAIVKWSERAQRKRDGTLMPNWLKQPSHMLGIRAETDAYKKARLVPDEYRAVDESPEGRKQAYARLHAAAAAQGMDHDAARQVVAQLAPGITSITDDDVSVEDIYDAASLIEVLGPDAIEDVDGEYVVDGGEAAPSAHEQWRIHVREVMASRDREAYAALKAEAGAIAWKWESMFLLAGTLGAARRVAEGAVRAGIRREDVDRWEQAWIDREDLAVAANAREKADWLAEREQAALIPASDPDRHTR